jgi:hypothetical protein
MPFGFHLAMDTLPSAVPTSLCGQRVVTPAFGYGAPHLSTRGTSTFLTMRFSAHTTTQSDFSSTCTSAVRFMAFADRPSHTLEGVLEISRFSCMLFLSVRGLLDYAGPDSHSR